MVFSVFGFGSDRGDCSGWPPRAVWPSWARRGPCKISRARYGFLHEIFNPAPPQPNKLSTPLGSVLYYGDCLRVLSSQIPAASVDLIYLDPPFNSKRDYNIPLGGKAQANVFQDTWVWSKTQHEALDYVAERDATLYQQLERLLAFASGGNIAGKGGLAAYLAYMAARLLACKRVLKDTGSIYLHCDPTAGHYLKLLMDGVFGSGQFRNEIVWQRDRAGKGIPPKFHWGRKHDLILFYSEKSPTFNQVFIELTDKQKAQYRCVDEDGRRYLVYGHSDKRYYLDEAQGKLCDVWTDIDGFGAASRSNERLGYPTQKPLVLLERIIRASSNEGDLVLDPFCGCGTAVEAAQRLGRRWIGIDIEPLAVRLMEKRLKDRCGITPTVQRLPQNFADARDLAATPYDFERWAIRLIPGAQPNFKQSGDGGLDGRAVIASDEHPQPLFGFQVKSGESVGRPVLQSFSGALREHGCLAGLLIVLEERNAQRLRGLPLAQERVAVGAWRGPRLDVWSVEEYFGRLSQKINPFPSQLPPLVGALETDNLLHHPAWQPRLDS